MLIECRFLFILHPVRLYPLTKQYERKNVAKVLELNFLAMDKFSRVSWCFISFELPREMLYSKGIDWYYRYRVFGDPPSQRSAENLAFSVARFFSKNGTLANYYMVFNFKTISTSVIF